MPITDQDPTLSQAITQAIQAQIRNVHTATPGRITKYDFKTQRAEVQPQIKRIFKDGTSESMPKISGVPVSFPRGNKCSLTMPLTEGDGVLLIFMERSIDDWLSATIGEIAPEDPRIFNFSDAVAIAGVDPFTKPSNAENNDDVLLRYAPENFSLNIRLKKNGVIEISNDGKGSLKIASDGKIAFGTGAEELVDLLEQTVDAIIASVTATAVGPQSLSKVLDLTFAGIKTKIASIKGSL